MAKRAQTTGQARAARIEAHAAKDFQALCERHQVAAVLSHSINSEGGQDWRLVFVFRPKGQ